MTRVALLFIVIATAASAAPSVKLDARGGVLTIDASRIAIGKKAVLATPKAGTDYPTDAPIPARLKSVRVIVLDATHRVAITLEPAKAGLDYPTDARPPTSAVWVFGNAVRLPLANIARLEHAVAGTDFPTDGPPTLDRDFYVAVAKDGTRTRIQ